jgi:hypothetical protein
VDSHHHDSADSCLQPGDRDVTIILERKPQQWACPNCPVRAVTFGQANRFHNCAGLAGIYAPLIPAGSDARVTVQEREDYVGDQDVRYDDDGRPIMSVTVTRTDGSNDVVAFAATAHIRGESHGLD